MYLDFLVKVPTVKGKITRRKKSNVVYIEYEYDRVYDPSRKYTFPKRVTIGCKLCLNGMPVPLLRNCYSIFNGTKYR